MTTGSSGGNTYMLDPDSPAEMARLINQGRFLTKAMGGALAGLSASDICRLQKVLDLACGPGGWVLDVAFEHPNMEVAGVDISRPMIDYANARARTQKLSNATFGVMDITTPLDFSDASFDLVNTRYISGVLLKEAWPPFMAECGRILRPGGILRLTEPLDLGISTSPTLTLIASLLLRAAERAGYGISPDGKLAGNTSVMPVLLRKFGYQNVQFALHSIEFSAGTEAWADCYHNAEIGYYLAKPLIVNMGIATEQEIDKIYQQALLEMHLDTFCGMWHYITVWGIKPE